MIQLKPIFARCGYCQVRLTRPSRDPETGATISWAGLDIAVELLAPSNTLAKHIQISVHETELAASDQ